jgi:hypothetical protein
MTRWGRLLDPAAGRGAARSLISARGWAGREWVVTVVGSCGLGGWLLRGARKRAFLGLFFPCTAACDGVNTPRQSSPKQPIQH